LLFEDFKAAVDNEIFDDCPLEGEMHVQRCEVGCVSIVTGQCDESHGCV
jgi:hypothetical protein